MSLKLLFLDIDGVLNDHTRMENGYSTIQPSQVRKLNDILQRCPDVKIVLSSAWRHSFDRVDSVQNLLGSYGVNSVGRVHGTTAKDPEIWTVCHPEAQNREYWAEKGLAWRKDQILSYIEPLEVESFVVLDDLPIGVPNLVQTEGDLGMLWADVERVCKILNPKVKS